QRCPWAPFFLRIPFAPLICLAGVASCRDPAVRNDRAQLDAHGRLDTVRLRGLFPLRVPPQQIGALQPERGEVAPSRLPRHANRRLLTSQASTPCFRGTCPRLRSDHGIAFHIPPDELARVIRRALSFPITMRNDHANRSRTPFTP